MVVRIREVATNSANIALTARSVSLAYPSIPLTAVWPPVVGNSGSQDSSTVQSNIGLCSVDRRREECLMVVPTSRHDKSRWPISRTSGKLEWQQCGSDSPVSRWQASAAAVALSAASIKQVSPHDILAQRIRYPSVNWRYLFTQVRLG